MRFQLSFSRSSGGVSSAFHILSVCYVAPISESVPDHYTSVRKRSAAALAALFVWVGVASMLTHAYRCVSLNHHQNVRK